MRAFVYTRVSSDPKGVGRSVAEQEVDCRAVCQRAGWEVARVFTDSDRSASRYAKRTRPAYAELVASIEGCDVLVTWEASRFQRDLQDYVHLRELCRSSGVLWSYSGRTYDLSRTDDRLSTGLDALLAERESDLTRERIMRAVRSNAVQGRPHGKVLFGYTREYDPRSGELLKQIILEDQATIIREAAQRFLSGETPNAIARDFNARGITAARGGKWSLTQIRRVLTNPAYNAQRVFQGTVIGRGDWPAILDDGTFNRCISKFADPRRKTSRDSSIKHLLSGIALCGVCGRPLKYGKPRGVPSYVCVHKFCVARHLGQVEALVTELILQRLERPDAAILFQRDDSGLDALLEEAAAKRARLEGFYDSAAEGEISPQALGRIEAQLLGEITELERKLQRTDLPLVLVELARDPRRVWAGLHITQRRECIRALVEVRILPMRRGVRPVPPESIAVRWIGE